MALGEVAARFLEQAYGIRLVSHTVAIGWAAGVERLPGKHGTDKRFTTIIVMVDDRPGQLARLFNDVGDADTGPNGLQNSPVITGIVSDGTETTVTGTINSRPGFSYEIELS